MSIILDRAIHFHSDPCGGSEEECMWQLIAFALCMIVLALWVKRISEKRKPPPETFLC